MSTTMRIAVFKHVPASPALCLHPLWRTLRRVARRNTLHLYLGSPLAGVPPLDRLDRRMARAILPGEIRAYRSMLAAETKAMIADGFYDLIIPDGRTGIMPGSVLVLPRMGTLFFHWGRLPEMRGMHTVEWCLMRGERPWASAFLYDAGVDTGDVLASRQLDHDPISVSQAYRAVRRLSWRLIDRVLAEPEQAFGRRMRQRPEDGVTYYEMCPPLRELVDWRLAGCRGPRGGADAVRHLLARLPAAATPMSSSASLIPILAMLKAPVQEIRVSPRDQLISALHFLRVRKRVPAGSAPVILGALHDTFGQPLDREGRLRLFNELAPLVERPDRAEGILDCPHVQAFLAEVAATEWPPLRPWMNLP